MEIGCSSRNGAHSSKAGSSQTMTLFSISVFGLLMHAGILMRALRKHRFSYRRSSRAQHTLLIAPGLVPRYSLTYLAMATTLVAGRLRQNNSNFMTNTVITSLHHSTSYAPKSLNPIFMLGARQATSNILTTLLVPYGVSKSIFRQQLHIPGSTTSTM